jgi:hypothetical protein
LDYDDLDASKSHRIIDGIETRFWWAFDLPLDDQMATVATTGSIPKIDL